MKHALIRSSFAALFTLSCSFSALAAPVQYTLDPSHTSVVWIANHFGFSNPSGKFADVKGTLSLDEANPVDSSLNVEIATGSVISGVPKLDEHLKTDAFFDSAKFPTATYVSKSIQMTGKNTAKVTGVLTLRGISKPVVMDVMLNKIAENPMTHNKTAGFSATATLKRSDFGVSYAIPAVADEVKLIIESEAFIPASGPAPVH